jgi:hypothetical protein
MPFALTLPCSLPTDSRRARRRASRWSCGRRMLLATVYAASVGLFTHNAAAQPLPRATVVAPSTPTTYHVRDRGGRLVTVQVPAMATPELQVSNRARRTVRATVQTINRRDRQVMVRTSKGQTLILSVPPQVLRGMRVGDQFILQVAKRSRR